MRLKARVSTASRGDAGEPKPRSSRAGEVLAEALGPGLRRGLGRCRASDHLVNNFRYEVGHLISPLIVQIKHPAFLDEREVRFIAARAFNVPEEFRTGAYGIIPYVSLGAGPHSAPSFIDGRDKSQLPIEGVVCGPTNESERPYVEQSVRRLLSTRGYEVPVTTSKVPYRF